ncbi:MAG: cytidine deaminase [Desulfobacca sp.]|nr:cytidine deaminase [Desulfobacca sp.]
MSLSPEDEAAIRTRLLKIARQVAARAYAPYSGFRVGAAVQAGGQVFIGVNVENSSYGLSLCAERAALAAAVAAGAHPITHLALVGLDIPVGGRPEDCLPCGACRQWLAELAPEAIIYIEGREAGWRVKELLPLAFQLKDSRKT